MAVENALVLAAARRLMRPADASAPGHDSLAGLLLSGDRRSARAATSAPTTSSICARRSNASLQPTPANSPQPNHRPASPAFGADDVKSPRTPAAWMIMLVH